MGADRTISIHAPRTGSDNMVNDVLLRNATISIHAPRTGSDITVQAYSLIETGFQSTLPARGATCLQSAIERDVSISIHAPRTGSDSEAYDAYEAVMISIHAPRTGSDRRSRRTRSSASDFNPRSPHGERRGVNQGIDDILRFQSTLPARGATFDAFQRRVSVSISIHAPRTGSDGSFQTEGEVYPHFNPRSPHGERPSRALTTLPPC